MSQDKYATQGSTLSYDPTITPFLNPSGIAVVGASRNPTKLGFGLARNLAQSGYRGAVHFVNPGGGTLMNRPMHKTLLDVPDPVDLAILLIPAQFVVSVLHDCGNRGIPAAVIAAGGFRETGPQGRALEDECVRIARSYGIRLIGPNCVGLIDTHRPFDTTFLPPPGPPPGDVAFISHSGAICAAVIDWSRGQGFGLSSLFSMGNQADVNETDMLAPIASDPYTRVITLYIEGIHDGRRFVQEASRVSRVKPIIALKVGRYESGRKAVASHTGALAGKESAYNAAFKRAGVIRADTSEALFDQARVLAWCPLPKGKKVAILTNAGGPAVTAADAVEYNGMQMATLGLDTQSKLRELLPAAANVNNPVDMLATASPQQFADCLRILLSDPDVHSAIVIFPPPPVSTAGAIARAIIPVIYTASKPVVINLMGERLIQEAVEYFRAERVPEYRFPERAAAALATLCQRADYLRQQVTPANRFNDVDKQTVRTLLRRAVTESDDFLSSLTAVQIAECYGIRVPTVERATSPATAVEIASRIGFPVALKIASPDIQHKSDVGGILLNLEDEKAVVSGYERVVRNAQMTHTNVRIEGVYIQKMLREGQEVIIGAVQDDQFGPLVMFGSGGVEVEGLVDVDFALAPLSSWEAEALIDGTWAGRKLHGFRHLPPADRGATVETVLRLAQLADDFPQLSEIEINPLRVLPDKQGAFALDVRMRVMAPNENYTM